MCKLGRRLRYLHLLTRHCLCNLLPEPTSTKHEYGRQFCGRPVTSPMTSSPWKILFWHNLERSFHIWGQIAAVFNISKFSKRPPFSGRDKLFTGCYSGNWIYQQYSHEYFRYFELLIDAVAQILTEIYQFQNLTYFVTWWRHQWRHEYAFV